MFLCLPDHSLKREGGSGGGGWALGETSLFLICGEGRGASMGEIGGVA